MEFTSTQVQKIFKINRSTFQDWIDRHFISPSIRKSSKQGDTNIFSLKDLSAIALFKHLCNSGLKREVASKTVNLLYKPKISTTFDPLIQRIFKNPYQKEDEFLVFIIRKYKDSSHNELIVEPEVMFFVGDKHSLKNVFKPSIEIKRRNAAL